jgi:hypothetical protein
MAECPGRYALAGLVCKELAAEEQARIEAHLTDCTACQKSLASLRANVVQFENRREQHWNQLQSRLPQEAKHQSQPLFKWQRFWVLTASAAVLMAFSLWGLWPKGGPDSSETTIAYKGALGVQVVGQRDQQQFLVEPDAKLQPNDALRFVITTENPGYLCVVSIDEKGKISSYYPNTDPQADPQPVFLSRAGRHELVDSIMLDEFTGREWLVVVFQPGWFSRSEIFNRLQMVYNKTGPGGLAPSILGFGGDVVVVPIQKVKKP